MDPGTGQGAANSRSNGVSSTGKAKKKLIKLRELCGDLKDLTYKWYSLGLHLGLETGQLSQIQENYGGTGSANRVDNYFASVMTEWREGDPNDFNKETLVEALRNVSYSGLAERVKKQAPKPFNRETVSTQSLCELLSDCKAKYSVLGVHLGVHPDTISAIEKRCGPGDCALCLQQVLQLYLSNRQPQVEELCRALVAVDRRGLSEELREKYRDRGFDTGHS